MIKVITTLKKKPELSTQEFRDYYETKHKLLGEKYLSDYVTRYFRRYTTPMPSGSGVLAEAEFDVLLEIWFEDEARLQACAERLNEPDVAREILLDEEQLFDRSHKRTYLVDEYESQIPLQD